MESPIKTVCGWSQMSYPSYCPTLAHSAVHCWTCSGELVEWSVQDVLVLFPVINTACLIQPSSKQRSQQFQIQHHNLKGAL